MQPFRFYRYVLFLVYSLLAGIILVMFLRHPGIGGFRLATVPDLIYGRAYAPYVHRALVPGIARVFVGLVSSDVREGLQETVRQDSLLRKVVKKLDWEEEFLPEYIVASLLAYVFFLAFAFSARYFFTSVYHTHSLFADLFGLVALLGLPPFFQYQNYMYDPSTLVLFTMGLAFMARGEWLWYVVVFAVGCVNRETTILLTLVFASYYRGGQHIAKGWFGKLIAVQVTLFVLIKASLYVLFKDNPGNVLAFHLLDHNAGLLYPYSFLMFYSWIAIACLVAYHWADKPGFLKHGLLILPALVAVMMLFGYLDEYRIYYEAYPVVLMLVGHSIADVMGKNFVSVRG